MCPSDGYVDQSPDELRLCVTDRGLDINQFSVLRSTAFRHRGLHVTAHVIGASHVLRFERDGYLFMEEVVACVTPREVQDAILCAPLTQLDDGFGGSDDFTSYYFRQQSVVWDERAVWLTHQFRLASGDTSWTSVSCDFPQGALSHVPLTAVLLRPWNSTSIRIATLHSYPGQGVVVTNTIVKEEQ